MAILACVTIATLSSCTYDEGRPGSEAVVELSERPTPSPEFTLPEVLLVDAPKVHGGLRWGNALPVSGECSFDHAYHFPVGDSRYLGPVYTVPGLQTAMVTIHGEGRLLTVSWPPEVYADLKRITPGVEDVSVKIFEITRESFESLMRVNPSLEMNVTSLGVLAMTDAFFVTNYDCIPLDSAQ